MDTLKPSWIVFSDDWGRHPSSCQYLFREILRHEPVTWVNTIGMRTPRLDMATLQRAWGKVFGSKSNQAAIKQSYASDPSPEPTVLNPKMWPWFTRRYDRALNRLLLTKQLARHIAQLPRPRIAVTTIPIVADIIDTLDVDEWVYYCVDDFSVWPGLDQTTMKNMEAELAPKVDSIVAVSEVLQERLSVMGRGASLLTHGVDLNNWEIGSAEFEWPNGFQPQGKTLLFWGVIDPRLDTQFIQHLARERSADTIVLVGPQQAPDPLIAHIENLKTLDAVSPNVLAQMAQAADCLIMPYRDAEVTRAMQPLKLKEYLATGKPVVVRDLPATRPWSESCDVATTAAEFAKATTARMESGVLAEQLEARSALQSESWAAKAHKFRRLIMPAISQRELPVA